MMDKNNKTEFAVIAGEVSGDHHGALLVRALRARYPGCRIWGIGGDRMISEGFEAIFHIRQMAFLGIGEVIRHLPFIRKVMREMKALVRQRRPEAVILIDYPGFNLRFAGAMKKSAVPVIYYISPQLWAWGLGRIKKIKKLVDKLLVVFPFEVDFYRDYGIEATYVGHPLVDSHYGQVSPKTRTVTGDCTLGLMPGSRQQELEQLLPDMLHAGNILMERKMINQILIAAVDHIPDGIYRSFTAGNHGIEIYRGPLEVFYNSLDAALVSSGTATLETAYFQVPLVIVYRVNILTWLLGRLLVRLPFIGLANIVAGEKVAAELLQDEFKPERAAEMLSVLFEPERNRLTREKLRIIRDKLGEPGASARAAGEIESFLNAGKE